MKRKESEVPQETSGKGIIFTTFEDARTKNLILQELIARSASAVIVYNKAHDDSVKAAKVMAWNLPHIELKGEYNSSLTCGPHFNEDNVLESIDRYAGKDVRVVIGTPALCGEMPNHCAEKYRMRSTFHVAAPGREDLYWLDLVSRKLFNVRHDPDEAEQEAPVEEVLEEMSV